LLIVGTILNTQIHCLWTECGVFSMLKQALHSYHCALKGSTYFTVKFCVLHWLWCSFSADIICCCKDNCGRATALQCILINFSVNHVNLMKCLFCVSTSSYRTKLFERIWASCKGHVRPVQTKLSLSCNI
jgi:hypothetical protein